MKKIDNVEIKNNMVDLVVIEKGEKASSVLAELGLSYIGGSISSDIRIGADEDFANWAAYKSFSPRGAAAIEATEIDTDSIKAIYECNYRSL